MIDAFIIESLQQIGMPPVVAPPVAITRSWDHQEVLALRKQVERELQEKEELISGWRTAINSIEMKLNAIPKEEIASIEQIASLEECVASLRARAESWIVDCRRAYKKADRAIKHSNLSAEKKAIFRNSLTRGLEIDKDVLQNLLDFAWVIRSFRAQVAPDKGSGPTFDNPEDLERFLATA